MHLWSILSSKEMMMDPDDPSSEAKVENVGEESLILGNMSTHVFHCNAG
jgi:hypothetical protein